MTNACCEKTVLTDCMTLAMLKAGSRGTILKFIIDCDDMHNCRFARRLKEMGLHEGASFEIAQNTGDGEVAVICEGTRIVLGRGMASKIKVEVSDGECLDQTRFGRFCRRFGIGCRM